jgi:hypothetical protein
MANNSVVNLGVTVRMLTAIAIIGFGGWLAAQAPPPAKSASQGVRCPSDFKPMWDSTAKVLRCRRDVVSWVVTTCSDREFATYIAREGADACGPTEIPGVGKPPGVRGSRAVNCAASGYSLMTDRTGERDRCERVERVFALPLPAG